jgi:hypothetical protein
MRIHDEQVSERTAALVPMLMQAGIVYTAEDREALNLRVYLGLTNDEPSSPTLYNLHVDC